MNEWYLLGLLVCAFVFGYIGRFTRRVMIFVVVNGGAREVVHRYRMKLLALTVPALILVACYPEIQFFREAAVVVGGILIGALVRTNAFPGWADMELIAMHYGSFSPRAREFKLMPESVRNSWVKYQGDLDGFALLDDVIIFLVFHCGWDRDELSALLTRRLGIPEFSENLHFELDRLEEEQHAIHAQALALTS